MKARMGGRLSRQQIATITKNSTLIKLCPKAKTALIFLCRSRTLFETPARIQFFLEAYENTVIADGM